MYRVFCHKQFQYWQHCKLCHRISELSIRNVIELGIKNATKNYFASQIQAAINMQAVYRGHSARFKFREAQSARRRVQMAALNIQHFLRYQRARKNMKKSREQKASFEQNRFRENFTSLHKLLAGIFSQCGSFFDSFDATKALDYKSPDLVLIECERRNSVRTMEACSAEWCLLYQDSLAQLWGRRSIYDDQQSERFLPEHRRHRSNDLQQGRVAWSQKH